MSAWWSYIAEKRRKRKTKTMNFIKIQCLKCQFMNFFPMDPRVFDLIDGKSPKQQIKCEICGNVLIEQLGDQE